MKDVIIDGVCALIAILGPIFAIAISSYVKSIDEQKTVMSVEVQCQHRR